MILGVARVILAYLADITFDASDKDLQKAEYKGWIQLFLFSAKFIVIFAKAFIRANEDSFCNGFGCCRKLSPVQNLIEE